MQSILTSTFSTNDGDAVAEQIARRLDTGVYLFTNFNRVFAADSWYEIYFLTESDAHYYNENGKRKINIEALKKFQDRSKQSSLLPGQIPKVGNVCTFNRKLLNDHTGSLDYLFKCVATTPYISIHVYIDRNDGTRMLLTILNRFVKILLHSETEVGFDMVFSNRTELPSKEGMNWGRLATEVISANVARFTSRALSFPITGYNPSTAIDILTKQANAQNAIASAFGNAEAGGQVIGLSEVPFSGIIGSPLLGASLSYYTMMNSNNYYDEITSQPFIENMNAETVKYRGLSPAMLRWNIDQSSLDFDFTSYYDFLKENEVVRVEQKLWDVLGISSEDVMILRRYSGMELKQFKFSKNVQNTRLPSSLKTQRFPDQFEPVRILGAENWFYVRKTGNFYTIHLIDLSRTKAPTLQILCRKDSLDRIREHLAFDHVYWELFNEEMYSVAERKEKKETVWDHTNYFGSTDD